MEPETSESFQESSSNDCEESLDEKEIKLTHQLRLLCDKDGKETNPKQSALILHKLGQIYMERNTMVSLIRSACLFNAAITRKPDNVQTIEDDLKRLCCQVLKSADSSMKDPDFKECRHKHVAVKDADLVEASSGVKKKVELIRKKVNQKLYDLEMLEKHYESEKEMEIEKTSKTRELMDEIAADYTTIMADLLEYCENVMGDPPCKYALIGMGSLARKEITPYSDFEHIIVLEEDAKIKSDYESILSYFRWMSVIFQVVVINLQETIVPCMDIDSLNWFFDLLTKRGISFDSMMPHACKFPIGRQTLTKNKTSTTELIKPVGEMLEYLSFENDIKNGYHLSDILTKVSYVGGDNSIFDDFQSKMFKVVHKKNQETKNENLIKMLVQDLDSFATRSKLLQISSTKFHIKRDFYRSSTIFISSLGQLHNIQASSCFDIAEALADKGVINDRVKHLLMYAVSLACELRLKWYMKHEKQDDVIENESEKKDFAKILLSLMNSSTIIKYFQISYALQCDISMQLGLKKLHFYSDPKLLNFKIYYRLGLFNLLRRFVETYNSQEFEKSSRLYSFEEIMDHFKVQPISQQKLSNITDNNTKVSDFTKTINLLFTKGLELKKMGNDDEALEFFKVCEAAICSDRNLKQDKEASLNIDSDVHLAPTLNNIGLCLMGMDKPGEAITYLKKSLKTFEQATLDIDSDVNVASVLNNIGLCLINMHKPGEAITYLKRALKTIEQATLNIDSDVDIALSLNNNGHCLMKMHKTGEAITYLKRSLKINEQAPFDIDSDVNVASTLNNIGNCLMDMHKPGEAITYLKRSLKIKEQTTLDIDSDVNVAGSLNNIGGCLMKEHKPGEAIDYLKRSLKIKERTTLDIDSDVNVASTLNNIGNCLMDMHKHGDAITYLKRSLEINKKATLDIDSDVNVASSLSSIGNCLINMHKPGEAITYLKRSLKIKEQATLDIDSDVNVASSLNNVGLCLMKMHKPGEAIAYLKRALKTFEQVTLNIDSDVNVASTLNSIGLCLMDMHKPGEAITYLKRSLKTYEQATLDIDSDVNVALALNNTGNCLMKMHKPGEAITYLKRSLKTFEQATLDIDSDVNVASSLLNIGNCLMDMHKHGDAIIYLKRSLKIKEQATFDLDSDVNVALALNNIGNCLRNMHKPGEALTYLKRSLKIKEQATLDIDSDVNVASTLNNIGVCLMDMHKPGEAITFFKRSLKIKEQATLDIDSDVDVASSLNNIGNCLMIMHKPGEAIAYLKRSLKIFEQEALDINFDVNVASIPKIIGICLMKVHKPGEAITYLNRAFEIYEQATQNIDSDVNLASSLKS